MFGLRKRHLLVRECVELHGVRSRLLIIYTGRHVSFHVRELRARLILSCWRLELHCVRGGDLLVRDERNLSRDVRELRGWLVLARGRLKLHDVRCRLLLIRRRLELHRRRVLGEHVQLRQQRVRELRRRRELRIGGGGLHAIGNAHRRARRYCFLPLGQRGRGRVGLHCERARGHLERHRPLRHSGRRARACQRQLPDCSGRKRARGAAERQQRGVERKRVGQVRGAGLLCSCACVGCGRRHRHRGVAAGTCADCHEPCHDEHWRSIYACGHISCRAR